MNLMSLCFLLCCLTINDILPHTDIAGTRMKSRWSPYSAAFMNLLHIKCCLNYKAKEKIFWFCCICVFPFSAWLQLQTKSLENRNRKRSISRVLHVIVIYAENQRQQYPAFSNIKHMQYSDNFHFLTVNRADRWFNGWPSAQFILALCCFYWKVC